MRPVCGYVLIPPLIIVLWWSAHEESKSGFLNFQLKAGKYDPIQLKKVIADLPQVNEVAKRNAEPIRLINEQDQLKDISKALNQTVVDKLGYFAELPIHRACLINRNKITSEGTPIEPKQSNIGALGIVPKNNQSLNFYARVGEKDCKSVFKKDLEVENFNPLEYAYPILTDIGPDDLEKIYKGEKYEIYLREITIDASNSQFVIRLLNFIYIH